MMPVPIGKVGMLFFPATHQGENTIVTIDIRKSATKNSVMPRKPILTSAQSCIKDIVTDQTATPAGKAAMMRESNGLRSQGQRKLAKDVSKKSSANITVPR